MKNPKHPKEIRKVEIGPSIGAHLGTGSMIFSWIGNWEEYWFKE